MNNVQEYLNDYISSSQSTQEIDWDNFFKKFEDLSQKTQGYIKDNFKFLPENQVTDFHDSYIMGGIKPNMDDNSFNLTVRMLSYEKLEDTSIKHPYREVDPIYVSFNIDNKFRSEFQKLAVKAQVILSVVYDEQNLGVVYLNQEGKTRHLYLEGVDLSNNQLVEYKPKNKLRF